ncbi:hypothetical protein NC653_005598 [Populus alba x Populus x berolinensis]|uniref:Uncharacterized protein n=1 Tax=Populus alba x Populus x berolinensis TaxID=444605 RepID=A0AAD6WC21_9ROSI|nr:hypothetical protein NC653_005598 [Populus alba x Populus x berolinensis]
MALDDNFTGFEYLADEDHPNFVKEHDISETWSAQVRRGDSREIRPRACSRKGRVLASFIGQPFYLSEGCTLYFSKSNGSKFLDTQQKETERGNIEPKCFDIFWSRLSFRILQS